MQTLKPKLQRKILVQLSISFICFGSVLISTNVSSSLHG